MNKIKSLLRNFKARLTLRIVSFFKAPYKYLADKVYDHIQEDMSNILENTAEWRDLAQNLQGIFITSSTIDDELNDCKTISDIDYEITDLRDKVDELESLCEADPFRDLDDDNHPVNKLFDERTEEIHDLIIEVKRKVDEPTNPNIHYLVSELQKAVQDKADIAVFSYLVDSLANKVADNG